jgi:hypothetical protein
MKKGLIVLIALFYVSVVNAQQTSVEKSVSGVQLGFMSAWGYHEIRLADKFALRGEVGLGANFWYHSSSFFGTYSGYVLFPIFTVEPRFYYNMNRRSEKQKRIDNNSANFIALNVMLDPGWIIASSEDNVYSTGSISFIPTWGIRRNLGKHFDYELGLGVGYEHIFNFGGDLVFRPHLRIGYHF